MFGWGSTIHGELGLGAVEADYVAAPTTVEWTESGHVTKAALGDTHSLFLLNDGTVYSCGNNDFGQLGHDQPQNRPYIVAEVNHITSIACGAFHSLAINQWGHVFSWGSDFYNQIGHNLGDTIQPRPRIVKKLTKYFIVQIAAGHRHSVALTNFGELITWGANNYGQLGIGVRTPSEQEPVVVKSMHGVPLTFICCGANHTFCVSVSGGIFGWGKNIHGQLGLNDNESKSHPTQLKLLRSRKVRYIACGEDFSVFLTLDGGIFTCGFGSYGQLGHGRVLNEVIPGQVVELMGTAVTQIACGRQHVLAFAPANCRLHSFGLGESGQLGVRKLLNASTPQVVLGPWITVQDGSSLTVGDATKNFRIRNICAGGDHCFAFTDHIYSNSQPADYRFYEANSQIHTISYDILLNSSRAPEHVQVEQDLFTYLETAFKSVSCWNASFLVSNGSHLPCTSQSHGINVELAENSFSLIATLENATIKELIYNSITENILPQLSQSPPDVEAMRIYVTLPMYHEFNNAKQYVQLHSKFAHAVNVLSSAAKKLIGVWWSNMSSDYFERMITMLKSVIIMILRQQEITEDHTVKFDMNLVEILTFLAFLNKINWDAGLKVSYECFYIVELDEYVDVRFDYVKWLTDKNTLNLYLCNYPFLFDAKAKTLLLETDQTIQMQHAMHDAVQLAFRTLFLNVSNAAPVTQFLVLNVSREHIVADTLRELSQVSPNDLKKPLKIKFYGEEAEDAGGVRKEFFMLLLRSILDPKYGMFKEFEETRLIWFTESSFEDDAGYFLIGMICGLAIYNFTIIDIPFPLALYKKLLNEAITLNDLRSLSPVMANSLQSLLDYDQNDLQDVFGISFEITRDLFGTPSVVELKPGGSTIPVTVENREEYVELYVDYIFNTSVKKQYVPFHAGFMKVCDGRVLQLFHSHELMSVVVGNENYDWIVLEESAEYKSGYSSSDQTILWFWEVVHEMSLENKKKFLLFLTGSDRIPIQGMKAIKIIIQPTHNGNHLPVAHTCFNLLDLPRYNTKEKLKYKLIQAIQQTEGFSIV